MARRASGALAEVRETKEELKIKELLILDLTKKQQEIEFKLNSFKVVFLNQVLYEEVKSARNKYVNEIQKSSQELAELKQRIKISQNELEILKNESIEKEKSLQKLIASTKVQIHERDKKLAVLNKAEYEKQELIEQSNQQANEIAKLNMITVGLQKDMILIRKQYEIACESRNYMGVQLIDRNDELCILYEKTNIQESIIKNGECEINKLEDEVRMIKIEINEVQRRIEASRKKAPEVPELAKRIKELNEELNSELHREDLLSEKLERLDFTETQTGSENGAQKEEHLGNKSRWREIQGEDPDPEALKAKIQVLEERLNSKKESLLEKELILDEVTNISENLRKQSIDKRRPTLLITKRVNELQAKLKDVTRKMMATISELSMFQANVIKLESEKNDLYTYFQDIRERVDTGLPPTDESEIEFVKILRDKKRYLEQREVAKRLRRNEWNKSF
jgi:chromosome segregation ATPase